MEILTSDLHAIEGVQVGHWTDRNVQTGCTVVRFDAPALTAVDIRGAAPGSRELDLLRPGMTVQRTDAILLTGGSAFGLAAADGVMQWLRERDRGFPTPAGPVPIVPAVVIFDLATGDPIAPDPAAGYAAIDVADPLDRLATGRVGAGTGATLGKISGDDAGRRTGGFVAAQVVLPEGIVAAFAVVNAYGALAEEDQDVRVARLESGEDSAPLGQSTTLLTCTTDIPLDHATLQRMTVAMHDGLARKIVPVHSIADGDVALASTLRERPEVSSAQCLRAVLAAELAVEAAIDTLRAST